MVISLPGAAVQWATEPPAAEGAHGGDWQPLAPHLPEPEGALQEAGRGAAETVQVNLDLLGQGERAGDPRKPPAGWSAFVISFSVPAVLQGNEHNEKETEAREVK